MTSRNWMLSLRYEDHLYAKLFHHLISLHCHDQVICWVWWKHGLEVRIKSITTRGSGISKIHKPKECGNGDGGSEGLFVLIQRQEWRNEAKEREPKPPSNIHKGASKFLLSHSDYSKNQVLNFCHPPATWPKEHYIMSYVKLV